VADGQGVDARAYPSDLVGIASLDGRRSVRIRPIRDSDGPGLVEFHSSLTPWSIYSRYFGAHPSLNEREVAWFTQVDYRDRLALIAEDGGKIVGVGRYDRRDERSEAEVAFVVADEWQGLGLGRILLRRLADAAKRNGIDTFVADTLAENRAMLEVFRLSGFAVETSSRHEIVHVRISIISEVVGERTAAGDSCNVDGGRR
jgi:GNAT superfamily N-acetyltransferase